jgi:mono/diheme cytochrome c family protein
MIDDVITWLKTLPGNNAPPEGVSEACGEPAQNQYVSCGQEIFEARCAVCHGPEGQGKESDPWYQGLALWKGDVRHLNRQQHFQTILNGRRFAFMPQFGETPSQGIPAPAYPLTNDQIRAVMAYERSL